MEVNEAPLDLIFARLKGPKLQSAPEHLGNCTGEKTCQKKFPYTFKKRSNGV